jgi:hypothetical protein
MTRWLVPFAIVFASLPAWSQSPTLNGSVRVQSGATIQPYANERVLVQIFEKNKNIATAELQTNQDGQYSMPTEDLKAQWYYRVQVDYQNTTFASDYFQDVTQPVPPITVAQTSGNLENLEASHIVFLEFGKNSDLIKVTHQLTIENKGQLAYHPNHEAAKPIEWQLFDGGFNLSLIENIERSDVDIDEEKNQMTFLRMILPGEKQDMRFSYLLPLTDRTLTYVHQSTLPSLRNHWVANQRGVRVIYPGVESKKPPEDLKDTFNNAFVLGSLSANQPHSITIKGYMRVKDRPLFWTFGGAILLFLLFMLVLFWKKQHTRAQIWTKKDLVQEIKRLQQLAENDPARKASIEKDLHHLKIRLYRELGP